MNAAGVCPPLEELADFLIACKFIPVSFRDSFRNLFDVMKLDRLLTIEPSCETDFSDFLDGLSHAAPNRTDTSFETPGSCMVMP